MAIENSGRLPENSKMMEVSTITERLRLALALLLLGVGFGLVVFGWYVKNDHFYNLGLTLGPSGLIVLVFEYLVRISLETRNLQQLNGIRSDTARSLEETASELRQIATFDLDRGELGLVGIYANRADAVRFAIARMIDAETQGIYIVGSTIFGLRCDVADGPQRIVLTPEMLLQKISNRKSNGCDIRILLTHPKRIIERHSQEAKVRSAERGPIASELRTACRLLTDQKLADCTKLYDGSPTCFTMVFKGQRRMIVNPYPSEGEAYNSWAVMIEDREKGIYQRFLASHVEGPWNNKKLAQPLTASIIDQLKKAEEEERKFANELEALKSKEAEEDDKKLIRELPSASSDATP